MFWFDHSIYTWNKLVDEMGQNQKICQWANDGDSVVSFCKLNEILAVLKMAILLSDKKMAILIFHLIKFITLK